MADSKGTTTSTNGMKVDTKLIRQLADMLADTGLTEIEVEDGDRKIRVARHAAPAGPTVNYAANSHFVSMKTSPLWSVGFS